MEDYREEALIFKALSDENRLSILKMLVGGEKCACKLLEGTALSQSGLSYHMKILSEAELVTSWPVGKWTHYALSRAGREKAESYLKGLEE